MADKNVKSTGCCKPFNPQDWQEKEIVWKDEMFVKDHIISFLHIPLNMGAKITQNTKLIENTKAMKEPNLMLIDEKSLWGADIYINVSKKVQDAGAVALSGKFLTKVFEGPYKNAGKWRKEMKKFVSDKNKKLKKIYFFYTTCPKCANAYGKNYVVLFAQVS